jgi:hypothetical protein
VTTDTHALLHKLDDRITRAYCALESVPSEDRTEFQAVFEELEAAGEIVKTLREEAGL